MTLLQREIYSWISCVKRYKKAKPKEECKTPVPELIIAEDNLTETCWHDSRYNPCVLVGNWFEERSKYLQPILHHKTTYDADFTPPQPSIVLDPNFLADRVIENHGVGADVLIEHRGTEYYNNYSSTYDLQYRHCPQGLAGPRPRVFNNYWKIYEPQQDYAINYGNITQTGITKSKKQQWYDELFNWRMLSTEYRDSFLPYAMKDLTTRRNAVPRKFSSGLCEINLKNNNSQLRGNKLGVVPDIPPCVPKKLSCGLHSGYALSPKCQQ